MFNCNVLSIKLECYLSSEVSYEVVDGALVRVVRGRRGRTRHAIPNGASVLKQASVGVGAVLSPVLRR